MSKLGKLRTARNKMKLGHVVVVAFFSTYTKTNQFPLKLGLNLEWDNVGSRMNIKKF